MGIENRSTFDTLHLWYQTVQINFHWEKTGINYFTMLACVRRVE